MVEPGGRLSLAAKPSLECRIGSQIGPQLLDCHRSTEPLINSTTHLGHAPAAQRVAQFVPAPDRCCAGSHLRDPPSTPGAILGHTTPSVKWLPSCGRVRRLVERPGWVRLTAQPSRNVPSQWSEWVRFAAET